MKEKAGIRNAIIAAFIITILAELIDLFHLKLWELM